MTLSRFLKDYIYIPLGGNRKGELRTYTNLFTTFLLGGIWHGAGWTFVFWGALHGLALIIHRAWQKLNMKLPTLLAWFITFNFINIAWVFFRAKEWNDAIKVLHGMFFGTLVLPAALSTKLNMLSNYGIEFGVWLNAVNGNPKTIVWLILAFIITLGFKTTIHTAKKAESNLLYAFIGGLLLYYSLTSMIAIKSEFLYFNF